MDSTAHISQAHLDKLLLRMSGNPDFKNEIKALKEDSPLEERISAVLANPKSAAILQDCVEFYDFKLKSLVVDSVRHKLTLEFYGGVQKTWNYYDMHFVADPEAYDERLEHLELAQRELEGKPSLMKEEQTRAQNELDREFSKAKSNRTLFLESNLPFSGTSKVLTYKGDKPSTFEITFGIPMEMARTILEKHKELEDNYRVVLNPLLSKDRYKPSKAQTVPADDDSDEE